MAKIGLSTLQSGYLDVAKLNDNFAKIEVWADTVLSRDGASPNQLEADLDLNGFTLLNVGDSEDTAALVTYETMVEYVDGRSSGLIRQVFQRFTATASQTVFNITNFTYQPNAGNLAVYKNGTRLFATFDYVETNPTTITLLTPAALNDKVQVVSNEFLATVELPPHQHPWGQITGTPVYTTRWPDWTEVTGKPSTFAPSAHTHTTADVTSGPSFPDQYRGVFVQAAQPTASRVGDLWIW